MPALKVAAHLSDMEDDHLSDAAVSFLRVQSNKSVETRLGDLEAWQVGANEYLAALRDLADLAEWCKNRVKIWLPIIVGAALGSSSIAEFAKALLKAAMSNVGHPIG